MRDALGVHHRHRLAHIAAGEVEHALPTHAVQGHAHRRHAVLIGAGAGGHHLVTGGDDALVQQHRATSAVMIKLGFRRDAATLLGLPCIAIHHRAIFQGGGGTNHAFGFGGVLHAGQFDHDAIFALTLDNGFSHTEFVDAIAQGGQVLLDRAGSDLLHFRLRHGGQNTRGIISKGQCGLRLGEGRVGFVDITRAIEHHAQRAAAITLHRAISHPRIAQAGTDVIGKCVKALVDGRLLVYLHRKVHAAHQVQAQHHGLAAQFGQPCRHGGGQIQRHRVVLTHLFADQIIGAGLIIQRRHSHHQVVALFGDGLGFEVGTIQHRHHLGRQCGVKLRATVGGDLDGGVLLVFIGQRIQHADRQNQEDEDIFPAREFKHCRILLDATRASGLGESDGD